MNDIIELIDMIEKKTCFIFKQAYNISTKSFLRWLANESAKKIVNIEILIKFQSYIEDFYEIKGHSWDKIILLFSQDEHDALNTFFLSDIKK